MYAALAQAGLSFYMRYKQRKEERKALELEQTKNRALTGEMLAITYNSILNQSYEAGVKARRMEEQIQMQKREAEGEAIAGAAHTGAAGRRVELSRRMAIEGGAERAMTQLASDAKMEQDALIDRADMEERAAMNRLFTGTPDLPANFNMATEVGISALSIYQSSLEDKEFERQRQRAIIGSTAGTTG